MQNQPQSPLPTRVEVAGFLRRELPGKNLHALAAQHGITVYKAGRKNKGWAGQTLEKVAALKTSCLQRPDGIDFELKSTTLIPTPHGWKPKETIKVTQLSPDSILEEKFEISALWRKLSRLILVGVVHDSEISCQAVTVSAIDITDTKLIEEIRAFWLEVQHAVGSGEMPQIPDLGTSRDLIQLRPVGHGTHFSTCPITGDKFPARAFYATKRLIALVLNLKVL